MRDFVISIVAVVILAAGCENKSTQPTSPDNLLVVGYLLNGNAHRVDGRVARQVTDIIYFSVEPSATGSVDSSRIKQADIDYLSELKDEHGFRLLLAVGGWGRSEFFSQMASDESSRKKFISELRHICLENNFDGIDYDWEFPDTAEQKRSYDQLIIETSQAVKKDGLIVTTALSPWQKLSDEAYQALDRIHIMAYDQGARHSTYETAVECVAKFIAQSIPRSKLCMGVPFYGRKIDETDRSITYRQFVETHQLPADTDEIDGYYFNGIDTIKRKTRYCLDENLGGVMIWELGQDTSDDMSLLRAIDHVRTAGKASADK